ncbi:MAG: O-antigen ligase family protein [Pseudomonadota bacterium]
MSLTARPNRSRVLLIAVLGASVPGALITWDLGSALSSVDYILRTWHLLTVAAQVLFAIHVFTAPRGSLPRQGLSPVQAGLLVAVFAYVLAQIVLRGGIVVYFSGIGWLVDVVFFAALAVWRPGHAEQVDKIWLGLGLIALAHMMIFAASLYILRDVPDYPWIQRPPGFTNIRHLAYLSAPAAAAVSVYFLIRHQNAALALLCYVGAVYFLLVSGARGGLVGMIAGIAITVGLLRVFRVPILRGRLVVLVLVSLVLVPATEPVRGYSFDTIIERFIDNVDANFKNLDTARIETWQAAYQLFLDNWLWGTGPVPLQFLAEDPPLAGKNHPHNFILQMLHQWGLPGTLLICAAASVFLLQARLADTQSIADKAPTIAIVSCMLTHGLIDGGLFYPFSVAIFLVAFADLTRPKPSGGGSL